MWNEKNIVHDLNSLHESISYNITPYCDWVFFLDIFLGFYGFELW